MRAAVHLHEMVVMVRAPSTTTHNPPTSPLLISLSHTHPFLRTDSSLPQILLYLDTCPVEEVQLVYSAPRDTIRPGVTTDKRGPPPAFPARRSLGQL